jgi:hypothetical protein
MMYLKAPSRWKPSDPNPFSDKGIYGPAWSCFCIEGMDRRANFCGGGKTGPFVFRLGVDCLSLTSSLADFLRYERQHGRQVIVACPESMDVDALVRQALRDTPPPAIVRPADPRWVVHSTTLDAWASIRADGRVKSLATLRREGKRVSGLGQDELGEPPDYADYVVLGRVDEVNAEHVVSSRQKGRIVTDTDLPYRPGIRLYFNNHRIIRAGLVVRDGLHTTKVHHELSLSPHMAASVSVTELPDQAWTPGTFWKAANDLFFRKIGAEPERSERQQDARAGS